MLKKLQEAIDTVYGTAYEDSFTIIHETTQKLIDEIAARMADETTKVLLKHQPQIHLFVVQKEQKNFR